MKKYSFLVFQPEYEQFLKDIQKIGVVHIVQKENDADENLKEKYNFIKQLDKAISFLSKREIDSEKFNDPTDGLELLNTLTENQKTHDKLIQKLSVLTKEKKNIEPWGNFSIETVKKLNEKGVILRYFICSTRKFDENISKNYDIEIINEIGGVIYFVLVQKGDIISFDFIADELPEFTKSLSQINKELIVTKKEIEKIESLYDDFASKYLNKLIETKESILESSEFDKILFNTEKKAADKIMMLEGWIPEFKSNELNNYLKEKTIVYLNSPPKETDNPPILLKNGKFAKMFEDIGALFSLPNYRELDLTPFFAPFFAIFFGFCLGDAGYGLLFILIGTLAKFKIKTEMRMYLSLIQILGVTTIFFGLLSGTFFGISLLDTGYQFTQSTLNAISIAGIKNSEVISALNTLIGEPMILKQSDYINSIIHILPKGLDANYISRISSLSIHFAEGKYAFLNNFRHLLFTSNDMFALAIKIGIVQIIFGMFVKMMNHIRKNGFIYSVSTIGWILLSIFGIIYGFIIKDKEAFKLYFYIALGLSSIMILFFANPKANIFISFGTGLWDSYSMITGLLGDVLSYIRLFALGISSAILGLVFNQIAGTTLDIPVLGPVLFVIILLFGHGINIFMSSLGSFVHPMRLTFVEFYKNAGFEGGGIKYKPFKIRKINN